MLRTESFGVNSKKVFAIRDELGGEFLGWGEREERAARRKLHASGAKKKKNKKREFFRTLENKEKGFFFFFFFSRPRARRYLLAQLNTLFLLSHAKPVWKNSWELGMVVFFPA